MNAQNIFETITQYCSYGNRKYTRFGLRVMTDNPVTGESFVPIVGEMVENSFDWCDGGYTGNELDGTSAVKIMFDMDADEEFNTEIEMKINRALERVEDYAYNGKSIVLLGSNEDEEGNDPAEILMMDAVVLATW